MARRRMGFLDNPLFRKVREDPGYVVGGAGRRRRVSARRRAGGVYGPYGETGPVGEPGEVEHRRRTGLLRSQHEFEGGKTKYLARRRRESEKAARTHSARANLAGTLAGLQRAHVEVSPDVRRVYSGIYGVGGSEKKSAAERLLDRRMRLKQRIDKANAESKVRHATYDKSVAERMAREQQDWRDRKKFAEEQGKAFTLPMPGKQISFQVSPDTPMRTLRGEDETALSRYAAPGSLMPQATYNALTGMQADKAVAFPQQDIARLDQQIAAVNQQRMAAAAAAMNLGRQVQQAQQTGSPYGIDPDRLRTIQRDAQNMQRRLVTLDAQLAALNQRRQAVQQYGVLGEPAAAGTAEAQQWARSAAFESSLPAWERDETGRMRQMAQPYAPTAAPAGDQHGQATLPMAEGRRPMTPEEWQYVNQRMAGRGPILPTPADYDPQGGHELPRMGAMPIPGYGEGLVGRVGYAPPQTPQQQFAGAQAARAQEIERAKATIEANQKRLLEMAGVGAGGEDNVTLPAAPDRDAELRKVQAQLIGEKAKTEGVTRRLLEEQGLPLTEADNRDVQKATEGFAVESPEPGEAEDYDHWETRIGQTAARVGPALAMARTPQARRAAAQLLAAKLIPWRTFLDRAQRGDVDWYSHWPYRLAAAATGGQGNTGVLTRAARDSRARALLQIKRTLDALDQAAKARPMTRQPTTQPAQR